MSEKNVSPNSDCRSTPPTNRKVRNPFDKVLIERLHKPLCSPGMCKMYKKRNSNSFRWDIDQACTLIPADIVACNSQFEPSPDPVLERIADEATDQFFSQEMVVPSPLESSKKVKPLMIQNNTSSIEVMSVSKDQVIMRHVSAQTILTLPPVLPPEIQKVLEPFCTFTQDQDISGEYEITANGSLRRKLLFIEEHSDMEQYDSEQTDDEVHIERRPSSRHEAHTPIIFSPDLSRDLVTKGMKRTFGTPLKKGSCTSNKPGYRNKILDVVDFSPIHFKTPKRVNDGSTTSSSFASNSISPVNKVMSSDEEKNNFTSPESDAMATCLDCITTELEIAKKGPCFCKTTPNKSVLRRSASLKESPPRNRKGSVSFSEKRSLSMSSLNRSRSVQKLDFSMDMSIDGSLHDNSQADSESTPPQIQATWSIVEETSIQQLIKVQSINEMSPMQSTQIRNDSINILDKTPIKTKSKSNVLTHEISRIRDPLPIHDMSLDNSLDENPLHLEDKKIDFNSVDLNFLTENVSHLEYANATKIGGDTSTSFKRIDSGFNENTFYGNNASSYYESAIKPSELTVTNISNTNNKTALKEISNVNWMRVDSGFKEENSGDSMQFYHSHDSLSKKTTRCHFTEAKLEEKENMGEDFDRFLIQNANKNDAMSMSDIFTEDITFHCNFSSTPSKNKSRKAHS